tara:strand:+ start:121 stop:516 length:396 start_codon:yes stop_codon:yes gene_type:complete
VITQSAEEPPKRVHSKKQEAEWKSMFGVDSIKKIKNWHHGATIGNMIAELPDGDDMTSVYDVLCSAVHFSPHTATLASGPGILHMPTGPGDSLSQINTLVLTCTHSIATTVWILEDMLAIQLNIDFPDLPT